MSGRHVLRTVALAALTLGLAGPLALAGVPASASPAAAAAARKVAAPYDFDGDGRPELVVGAPGEDGTGRVTTLPGTGSGLTTTGSGTFGLADLGVRKGTDADFGRVLGP